MLSPSWLTWIVLDPLSLIALAILRLRPCSMVARAGAEGQGESRMH
jgi:hypothetical protein